MSAVKILKKLQRLDLAGNVIRNVSSEPFTKLDALHFLDLGGNLFASVCLLFFCFFLFQLFVYF